MDLMGIGEFARQSRLSQDRRPRSRPRPGLRPRCRAALKPPCGRGGTLIASVTDPGGTITGLMQSR
jgi:hypothetical protein